jgi:ABC-type multidrug transport system ATPase subunit
MALTHRLEVDGLRLAFGSRTVLGDIYLKLETGQVTGLLGPNGAGKSCLLQVIFGELAPPERSVRLDGRPWLGRHRAAADLRYLPQFNFIPKSLTVKRVFADFGVDFSRLVASFPEFSGHYLAPVSRLSGGEARLVEVFVVLMAETKFCLLDEPVSHLAPARVEVLQALIKEEKSRKGILITDHLYRDVLALQDTLYVLHHGKTRRVQSVADLARYGYLPLTSDESQ